MNPFTDASFGSLFTFIVISFLGSLVVTLVYKYTTNQRLMKQLRLDITKYQEQMKKTKDTKKLLEIQKKAMDINMKYMMQSLRPTLFTFLPFILILGIISSHLAFSQIHPNSEFNVSVVLDNDAKIPITATPLDGLVLLDVRNNSVSAQNFTFKGPEGKYVIEFSNGIESVQKRVIISSSWKYEHYALDKSLGIGDRLLSFFVKDYEKLDSGSSFKSIHIIQSPVRPFGDLKIFGYAPGWIATYFLFSLIFSMLLRKLFDLS